MQRTLTVAVALIMVIGTNALASVVEAPSKGSLFGVCEMPTSTPMPNTCSTNATAPAAISETSKTDITKKSEDPPLPVLPETLAVICSCESIGKPNGVPHHFDSDGTVLRGRVDRNDIGACQINSRYHERRAESLGYDIYTKAGNFAYAKYLYNTQGTQPWSASRSCWA